MATNITYNGIGYSIPLEGDSYGDDLSSYLIALATGSLQKSGGDFVLTSDVNFGNSYGLKSIYLKSLATNPASVGVLRLGNTESVSWRNAANNADLSLSVNATNKLIYNSNELLDTSMSAMTGLITNTQVSNSAAIAYSKLNLTGSLVNADINPSAAIAYSKLNIASGDIAYSKLSVSNSIVNADINSTAAIALSKLAALSTSKVIQTNSSTGFLEASTVTNTELALLSGKTGVLVTESGTQTITNKTINGSNNTISNISLTTGVTGTLPIANGGTGQTTQSAAFDALSPMTTKGDLVVNNGTNDVRLPVGTDTYILTSDSTQANGVKWSAPSTVSTANVISKTTTYTAAVGDDIINCSGSAFTITLYPASGNSGKSITIKKTDSSFSNIITIDANGSETIDGSLTTTLNTQYESLTLYCDGSNWFRRSRDIPSKWTAYTPTINGFGTPTGVNFAWRRVGDSIQILGSFTTGTVSASTAEFTLPSGVTADSGVISTYTYYGDWIRVVSTGSTRKRGKLVISGGSTTIGMTSDDYTAALGPASALAGNVGFANTETVKVSAFNIPITGWQ